MPRLTISIASLLTFTPACDWENDEHPYDVDFTLRSHSNPNFDPNVNSNSTPNSNRCGNGAINGGEECDLGLANADDGACTSACLLAVCGDGLVQAGVEQCDDGGVEPGDGCSDACTREPCTWDVANLPANVWAGQAVLGEIAFDGNCDLLVGGGEEQPNLYRVSKDTGSSTFAVQGLAHGLISGMTYRASDNRVYFSAGMPDAIYALDAQDNLELILDDLQDPINSLTVAPAGFGEFGDQLIAVAYSPAQLLAIDPETQVITPFAQYATPLSVAAFGSDGTLYVADWSGDRISTVTAEGVFTPFYEGLNAPDGLAISSDGTQMFVAYLSGIGRIDRITIADKTLTPGIEFELSTGFAPTGIVVDGANHVLYEMPFNNFAVIDAFQLP